MALWELKAIVGNHKAVRRREIYQAVTISALRAQSKLDQDMPCFAMSTGPGLAFQSPAIISMSNAGTLSNAS